MCEDLPRLRQGVPGIRQDRLSRPETATMKHHRPLPKLEDFESYRPTAAQLAAARARTYDDRVELTRRQTILSWTCRVIAAGIMLETLFFKFTGAPESVYIFSQMNLESWWRYGQGVWELIASVLLLLPRTGWAGGVLTLGAIGAAIVSHLTVLGIEIQGDGGLLFGMAWTAFLSGAVVTFLHRREIPGYVSLSS
jgi:hypothetical protein